MTGVDRYVLLGLAAVRSAWFREVSRWSNSASLPIEFVKAMSVEEVRARLGAGRGYSALLVDDSVVGVDRDLVETALEAGCAVLVVDHGRSLRSWSDIGASASLPPDFEPSTLLQVLAQVARPIAPAEGVADPRDREPADGGGWRGRLVAVTGPGGTGTSTVAIGLAQGLARDPRRTALVCLADLALAGEQAMLHASPDVVPGLSELVEAHRLGRPTVEEVRQLTWEVDRRGYRLLLGLRRHRDWASLRPRAVAAAVDSLQAGFRVVVADVDADVEGERATGSVEVEERNVLARTAVATADLVVVVGSPGMKGLHSLCRVVRDLLDHGVPAERVVPVVNRSAKGPRPRAELTRALGQLLAASTPAGSKVPSPLHLAERRQLETALRDAAPLPDSWASGLTGAVSRLLDAQEERGIASNEALPAPVPVAPGSLGHWPARADGEEQP